jgi:hypothetical protein
MDFSRYRHCAKAISDILQDTWKEMTILSFFLGYSQFHRVFRELGNPPPKRVAAYLARGAMIPHGFK